MKTDKNYEKLRHPGESSAADKKSWEEVKKIIAEVRSAPENQNPIPNVCHYFSGKPTKKWQKHYFDLPDVRHFHFVKFK